MKLKIQIFVVFAIVAIIVSLSFYVYVLRQDRAMIEKDLNAALTSVNLLAQETQASQRAMLVREEEAERLRMENKALSDELRTTYENDPLAKEWADVAIPDSVLKRLRP